MAPFSSADVVTASLNVAYADRPSRYIVATFAFPHGDPDRLTGPQTDHDVRILIRSVGKTDEQCLYAAEHAERHLFDALLEMDGRTSSPITHPASEPVRRDPAIGDGLFFCDDEYAWFTTPSGGG